MLVSRRTSVRICFGSPFSSKVVVCRHCLVILSPRSYETLKCFSSLPTLMKKSFRWWQCRDRNIISLSPPPPPPYPLHPFPLLSSLISPTVSVDVKQHVYFSHQVTSNNYSSSQFWTYNTVNSKHDQIKPVKNRHVRQYLPSTYLQLI